MQLTTKQTIKAFWRHTMKYKLMVFLVVIFSLVEIAAETIQPFFYRNLINFVSGNYEGSWSAINLVLFISACTVTTNFTWRIIIYFANRFQAWVKRDLYQTTYNYTLDHSLDFFSNNFVGSIVTKIGRYNRAYESISDEIIFGTGRSIIYLVVVFAILVWYIPLAGVIIGVWIILHVIISLILNSYRYKFDLKVAEQDSLVTGHTADTIGNLSAIKASASELRERHSFGLLVHEQSLRLIKTWDLTNLIDGFQGFSMMILEFAILFFSVKLWQVGKISVGDFVLLQAYMLNIFHLIWNIGRNMRKFYQSLADANEMTEIMLTPHDIQDSHHSISLRVNEGKIQFKNVLFSYKNQEQIFDNFNLQIKGGERVALVGPSGGGKSTIVKLLFRFYDLNSGSILIDEQNISNVTQSSLREQLSLVPQDPVLFHRSILENIRYAKQDALEEEVFAAAKAAHCHEFIDKLPQKYETMVGERGVKLSGGERQRVAIARAILKNAPILVLDEATSSLDSESENLIQDALKFLMQGKTTIVIAHRLSTIMAMDRIVVIEGGKVTEEGKHEELLKAQEGKYQKLWHIQSGSYT